MKKAIGQTVRELKRGKQECSEGPWHRTEGLTTIVGMLLTTFFVSLIIGLHWEKIFLSVCFTTFFGTIESFYIVACALNFQKGASFPVIFVGFILIVMLAWHYGTIKKYEFDVHNKVSINWLTTLGSGLGINRVQGIGFVHTDKVVGIPAFFSHFVTNLPAFHQVLIFISFKNIPFPYVHPSKPHLIGRVGLKEYRVYRCIVRYGYRDRIRGIYNLEDHIIHGIMKFISLDDASSDYSTSAQNIMIVTGNLDSNDNKWITTVDSDPTINSEDAIDSDIPLMLAELSRVRNSSRRRPVQFLLPLENPQMNSSARAELQELVDAREHGTTCILGQPHFRVQRGSRFLKRLMIMIYIFLAKNTRNDSVAMTQHATYIEVVYAIYSGCCLRSTSQRYRDQRRSRKAPGFQHGMITGAESCAMNHLSGLCRSYLKITFDIVQQLMHVKNDLLHVVERN